MVIRVILSIVAAFLASAAYYIVFASVRAKLSPAAATGAGRPGVGQIAAELVRNLLIALTLVWLAVHLSLTGWAGAARLAAVLWIGFPFVLLTGSVMYEHVPWRLAALHAGDWLIKLPLMLAILVLGR